MTRWLVLVLAVVALAGGAEEAWAETPAAEAHETVPPADSPGESEPEEEEATSPVAAPQTDRLATRAGARLSAASPRKTSPLVPPPR